MIATDFRGTEILTCNPVEKSKAVESRRFKRRGQVLKGAWI